jgi:hypothetical protein
MPSAPRLGVAKSIFLATTSSSDLAARKRAEAIVTASVLNNPCNAQAAPTSRFARDIRVRWRVPLPLHLVEIRVTPQRMFHAVLNRMKCEGRTARRGLLGSDVRHFHMNIPSYASVILTADEIVDAISSVAAVVISANT